MNTDRLLISCAVAAALSYGCKESKPGASKAASKEEAPPKEVDIEVTTTDADFRFVTGDRLGDSAILRYRVPGFEQLDLRKKKLLYYLAEAGLSGRDIIYDQKFKHNLVIRRTLEAILGSDKVDRNAKEMAALVDFTKQVWFARGIHHDYSKDKILPEFSKSFFAETVRAVDPKKLPLQEGETVDQLIAKLTPILFDPKIGAKGVNRNPGADPVKDSANNFYEGLTEKEVRAFYKKRSRPNDPTPVSHGLNSKLVKENGKIVERVWKVGGMYGPAIEKIVGWLEKAVEVAENDAQKKALELLIQYYKTGDLKTFDDYSVAWVQDTESMVDTVNGFIEFYGDAIAYKATYEAVVSFKDLVATKRIKTLGDNAQWFEDNSPIAPAHKKKNVVGISAKVITVVTEAGDTAPTTPIGINLPNANWIRKQHGSKSVTIGNIIEAYEKAQEDSGLIEEFAFSKEQVARVKAHGGLSQILKVDLHEVIGHASGQINAGVGTPKETLKSYSSALEEGRADLVALYFVADPKLIELGLAPSDEVGKAAYDGYIRGGLMMQLSRIKKGRDIEESHMRNRQMVASWVYEKGKADNVIEKVKKDGKTYFVIRDYAKLRTLFGELLAEVQRIKSEGDFAAGKKLIETYGVEVDPKLHAEVLERYAKLDVPRYYGFIQPKLVPVEEGGQIVDIKVEYPEDFMVQQMSYSASYSFLPDYN